MGKPTPLKALKFFKAKFPTASWMDAALIVGSMRMINTLIGAYMVNRMDKLELEAEKKGEKLPENEHEEEYDRFERTFGPQAEVADIMEHFFGVDKREYDFDPATLSDYLNHSPVADKMFGKQKTKEIAAMLFGGKKK